MNDDYVNDIDQNHVGMPEATPKKLFEVFNEVQAASNRLHADFKKSGSHEPWGNFSGGE